MGSLNERLYHTGDFILGLFIWMFSLFVIEESLRMPARGHLGILCYPGFVPFFSGLMIFLLSSWQIARSYRGALRAGGLAFAEWIRDVRLSLENRRFLAVLFIMCLYVIVFLGRIPFIVATFLYHLAIFSYLRIGRPPAVFFWSVGATLLVAVVLPYFFDMPVP
ncbi:hypothetical protein [Thermodesulforhabdus norvegica]|uniref:Tripartite tricarboxylate transporter TctB family protein n=1 Tax=Thermodesulforhabdus norvegica TaxID=39841 RepID=A0A1I4R3V6_9BACT|nr:hypothetical protein [Thermodesulforhabdus norvegica]SFM46620.1 hypothetical protein SAMN05660836_00368 [Thermodesulforhabdus norvegica]